VPFLLNLSFTANSSTVNDPGIKPGEIWNRERKRVPATQGRAFGRLNVMPFLERGFGVATVYYGDIDPDFAGGVSLGVRRLFLKPGQTGPASGEWGAISAWAWGLSRALDYLETDKGVDARRVAIVGVSRLGKTVLWAGARDPRIAMVIASCSGEGGAALSRRNYGETIAHLVAPTRYPYQLLRTTPGSPRIQRSHRLMRTCCWLWSRHDPCCSRPGTRINGPIQRESFLPRSRLSPSIDCYGRRGWRQIGCPRPANRF
jgi:hypothetical protein